MSIVVGRAPGRVSLVGGGTDLPGYFERHGGAVVSIALSVYSYAQASSRPRDLELVSLDHGPRELISPSQFTRRMRPPIIAQEFLVYQKAVAWHFGIERGRLAAASELPCGGGLGSSASLCVALITAAARFAGEQMDRHQVAEAACRVEMNVLRRPVGKQDPFAAAFGGLNMFEFLRDGAVAVSPLDVSTETVRELESRLMLFDNGGRRNASAVLAEQARRTVTDPQTIDALHRLKETAYEMRQALESSRLDDVGRLLHRGWEAKRLLNSQVSTPAIDRVYGLAREAGALGGKLAGAGLAGTLLLYGPPERRDEIRRTLASQGWRQRDVVFDWEGAALCAEVGTPVSSGV